MINIYFIGQLQDFKCLDSMGLGTVWTKCSGSAICYGMAAGLETLASQAFGARGYQIMIIRDCQRRTKSQKKPQIQKTKLLKMNSTELNTIPKNFIF